MISLAKAAVLAASLAAGDADTSVTDQSPSGQLVMGELINAIRLPRSGTDEVGGRIEEHLLRALAYSVVATQDGVFLQYGNKGGLALWQLERATDTLEAHIDRHVCVGEVARECNLTASYFARAFKVSTGVTPSQWLVNRRIAEAKTLLSTTPKTLSEIALDCGFTDQSHFTRVFAGRVGLSPGRWRASWRGTIDEAPDPAVQIRLPHTRSAAGEL